MNKQQLDAIRERVKLATVGPWLSAGDGPWQPPMVWDNNGDSIVSRMPNGNPYFTPSDSDFIAHARTDIPALLSLLDKAREALDWVRTCNRAPHCVTCADKVEAALRDLGGEDACSHSGEAKMREDLTKKLRAVKGCTEHAHSMGLALWHANLCDPCTRLLFAAMAFGGTIEKGPPPVAERGE